MTTTRNKIAINETLHLIDKLSIISYKRSEYIMIKQNNDIICIQIDEIPPLISSLKRFRENGEICDF